MRPNRRQALALDALGNPTRREILRRLAREPMPVGELAGHFPISRPAVSKHLRLLQAAGLVTSETQGKRHYCRLERAGFEAAASWLDRFWDDALHRFKLLAENTEAMRDNE
jgi:DNA-binding transcriptional ArsR family regulator